MDGALRQAIEALTDMHDMLMGLGRHRKHQREQVGRCVYCSCGLRVQGQLPRPPGSRRRPG